MRQWWRRRVRPNFVPHALQAVVVSPSHSGGSISNGRRSAGYSGCCWCGGRRQKRTDVSSSTTAPSHDPVGSGRVFELHSPITRAIIRTALSAGSVDRRGVRLGVKTRLLLSSLYIDAFSDACCCGVPGGTGLLRRGLGRLTTLLTESLNSSAVEYSLSSDC